VKWWQLWNFAFNAAIATLLFLVAGFLLRELACWLNRRRRSGR
jgi:uncharacterized membrane protein YhiD involved in acid resistance